MPQMPAGDVMVARDNKDRRSNPFNKIAGQTKFPFTAYLREITT
jgi:hypothetical protein